MQRWVDIFVVFSEEYDLHNIGLLKCINGFRFTTRTITGRRVSVNLFFDPSTQSSDNKQNDTSHSAGNGWCSGKYLFYSE